MKNTISYSEKVKGWTSFWDFEPGLMMRLNNRFFSVKNGQLYLHHANKDHFNEFYEQNVESSVKTIFNQENQFDKIFKNIVLESLLPWRIEINTNYTEGTIAKSEFNQHESRWFAHTRKNEDVDDLHGGVVQGIGNITNVASTNLISFDAISEFISTGDQLYQMNSGVKQLVGDIDAIDKVNNVLTLSGMQVNPTIGNFCFSKKNSRVEGSEIRGRYLEVILYDSDNNQNELFAVSTRVSKSFI